MRTAAIFLSLIFSLFVSEFSIRILGIVETYSEKNFDKYISPFFVPPLPYQQMREHRSVDFNLPPIQLNSFSIRDQNYSIKKKDELRILLLGDSFTFGIGANDDKTLSVQLLSLLKKDFPKKNISIINGGVPGEDIISAIHFFNHRLFVYNPDLIFYILNSSDIYDVSLKGGPERYDRHNTTHSLEERIWEKSHLFRLIMMRLFKWDWNMRSPKEARQKDKEAMQMIAQAAYKFYLDSKKLNRDFYLVFHPHPEEIIKNDENLELREEILKVTSLPFFDLYNDFKINFDKISPSEFYWPSDRHFNDYGYTKFAEILYPKLKEIVSIKAQQTRLPL